VPHGGGRRGSAGPPEARARLAQRTPARLACPLPPCQWRVVPAVRVTGRETINRQDDASWAFSTLRCAINRRDGKNDVTWLDDRKYNTWHACMNTKRIWHVRTVQPQRTEDRTVRALVARYTVPTVHVRIVRLVIDQRSSL